MTLFFHDLRRGQCKFVTGHAPWRFSAVSIAHDLATACGKPVVRDGAAYCTDHAALTAGVPAKPYSAPADKSVRRVTPTTEDREPDLCELAGVA